MITISSITGILTPGHPLVIRDDVDAADGSAHSAKALSRTRDALRQAPVLRLFPAFICAQALLIATLLFLNYLDSIG